MEERQFEGIHATKGIFLLPASLCAGGKSEVHRLKL
jgi:hypothetical protein